MATATTTRMTADEFFEFVHQPKNAGRWFELERGEVIELPPPGFRHGIVCLNTGALLHAYAFTVGRGYVCTNDTGVIVEEDPDTVRGADVSLYDDDGKECEEIEIRYAAVPPLLVAEVLSPDDRISRIIIRIDQYLKRGVGLVWLIDPEARTVTIYRKGREPITHYEDDELTGEDVFKRFRCQVADLFTLSGNRSDKEARK